MAFDTCEFRSWRLAASLSGALLSAAGLLAAGPALAGDVGDSFGSVLSFVGIQSENGNPAIDYTPRAPLAVPPTRDLPQPQSKSSRAANWPSDPDAVARRRAEADSRRPAPRVAIAPPADPNPITVRMTDCPAGACGDDSFWDKVKATFTFGQKKDVKLSAAEPGRDYLVDPPPGYRRPLQITEQPAPPPRKEAHAVEAASADAKVKVMDQPAQPPAPQAPKEHWGLW